MTARTPKAARERVEGIIHVQTPQNYITQLSLGSMLEAADYAGSRPALAEHGSDQPCRVEGAAAALADGRLKARYAGLGYRPNSRLYAQGRGRRGTHERQDNQRS